MKEAIYSSIEERRERKSEISIYINSSLFDKIAAKKVALAGQLKFFGKSYQYTPSEEYIDYIKQFTKVKRWQK